MAGGKKNKKNNSNYENLKPRNVMECVIRIFMNFVLLSSDYVSFDLNVP